MLIKDLPEDLKKLALDNAEFSTGERKANIDLRLAFNLEESPEGGTFWTLVNNGGYDEARAILKKKEESCKNPVTPQEVFNNLLDVIPQEEEKYVRRFPSGAVRSDDRNRLRPDYISPYALEEVAKHFTKNEGEFGSDEDATNYFKGIRPVDVKGSIARHYLDLMQAFHPYNKEIVREELRALASNCLMALHQIVIEEKGLYKEFYEGTEYIKKNG